MPKKFDKNNQRFGVELEFTGICREHAATVINNYFNEKRSLDNQLKFDFDYEDYKVKDEKGREWVVKQDYSIEQEMIVQYKNYQNHPGEYWVELVTPILKTEDIEDLLEIARKLNNTGAKANDSCGLHVHVSASNHDIYSIEELMRLVFENQDILYKALEVKDSREDYCKKISRELLRKIYESTPKTLHSFNKVVNSDKISSRKRGLNLSNILNSNKHTIEFRFFNGTLDADQIEAYIQLSLAMSAKAINNRVQDAPVKKLIDRTHYKRTTRKIFAKCLELSQNERQEDNKAIMIHWLRTLEIEERLITELVKNLKFEEWQLEDYKGKLNKILENNFSYVR